MITKLFTTNQLRIGDVVQVHNGRFELTAFTWDTVQAARIAARIRSNRRPNSETTAEMIEDDAQREESLRSFRTNYLGLANDGWPCGVPDYLIADGKGWMIQGNHLAAWDIEISR